MSQLQLMACFHRKHPRRIKLNRWGSQAQVPGHLFRHPLYFDRERSWPGIESLLGSADWTWSLCVFWRLNREKLLLMGELRVITINGIRTASVVLGDGVLTYFLVFTFFTVSLNLSTFSFPVLPHLKHLHKHTLRQINTDVGLNSNERNSYMWASR